MPAVHIRDVSEKTLATIKERAALRGHSVQRELREALDRLAAEPLPARRRRPLQLKTVATGRTGTWERSEIYGDDGR